MAISLPTEEIRQQYRNGLSTRELSDNYYCDHVVIWKIVRDIKVKKISKQRLHDNRIKQIRDMHNIGVFGTHIARVLGISKYTVYNYLRG